MFIRPFPTPQWNLEVVDPPPDRVVLVSSGVDSMICADMYPDAKLLFVDFGQAEVAQELAHASMLFDKRGFHIARLSAQMCKSADGVFVPARNLLFACIAAQYGSHIVMGGMLDDRSIDKTPTAFRDMSRVLTDMSGKRIVVSSPLFQLLKHEAITYWLNHFNGTKERLLQTWSCYGPGPSRCLECKACMRWAVALRVNGVDVPMPSFKVVARYMSRLHYYDPERQWAILRALKPDSIYVVDIDGVLTHETKGTDYKNRTPNLDAIDRLRRLPETNPHSWVVLHTSRCEIDRTATEIWLVRNRVPYHALLMGKPPADLLFDDVSQQRLG